MNDGISGNSSDEFIRRFKSESESSTEGEEYNGAEDYEHNQMTSETPPIYFDSEEDYFVIYEDDSDEDSNEVHEDDLDDSSDGYYEEDSR